MRPTDNAPAEDPGDSDAARLTDDPWRLNEDVRRRRLREQAARPLAANLAEGLALSELLGRFRGAARR